MEVKDTRKKGEWLAIESVSHPQTVETLVSDFRSLGLSKGMTVIVHSSMSKIGWVCGGPVAVIHALMEVLTEEGTLIMPAHTGGFCDPSLWGNPPVPESWWQTIRDTMPAFDPKYTPTRSMGAIAEIFRSFPGVLRSNHPVLSFCAWGKHKEYITENHSLEFALGETSPLARIYDLDGQILLLGVGHGNNTSLHLSENRSKTSVKTTAAAPIMKEGKRIWAQYSEIDFQTDLFEALGADFEKTCAIKKGAIGSADARLFRQRDCVDFGTVWFNSRA